MHRMLLRLERKKRLKMLLLLNLNSLPNQSGI